MERNENLHKPKLEETTLDGVRGYVVPEDNLLNLHYSIQKTREHASSANQHGITELGIAFVTGILASKNPFWIVPGSAGMITTTLARMKSGTEAKKELSKLEEKFGMLSNRQGKDISEPSSLPKIQLINGKLGSHGKLFMPLDAVIFMSKTLDKASNQLDIAHKYIVYRTVLAYTMAIGSAIEGSCNMFALIGPVIYFNHKAIGHLKESKRQLRQIDEMPGFLDIMIPHTKGLIEKQGANLTIETIHQGNIVQSKDLPTVATLLSLPHRY